MPRQDVTALLGVWEGYRVGTIGRYEPGELGPGEPAQVLLELVREPGPFICAGCGAACAHQRINANARLFSGATMARQNHAPCLTVRCRTRSATFC